MSIGETLWGCFVSLGLGFSIGTALYEPPINKNPDYVNPKGIEFKVEDKDQDGKKETYLKYKGMDFLLKDVNGKPEAFSYDFSTNISTKPYVRILEK